MKKALGFLALGTVGFIVFALASGPAKPTGPADRQLCAQALASADGQPEIWCDPEKSREMLDRMREAVR